MEALEIESQTSKTRLVSRCVDTAQGELAKAQHLLDDADHRFNRAFACAVDGFAQRRPELVGHLDLGTRVLGWGIGEWGETPRPSGMMGITARGDVGLAAPLLTRRQGRGAKIPGIQCRPLPHANGRWNGIEPGVVFL